MPDPDKGTIPVDDTLDDARAAFEEVSKAEAAPETNEAPVEQKPETEAPQENETPEQRAERERDEKGRFVAKEKDEKPDEQKADAKAEQPKADAEKQADQQKPADQQQQLQEQKPEEVKAGPPPSWAIPAKAAWEKLPTEVRAAVAKREQEVNAGLAELKDYRDLKPFRERAQRSGQSLSQAINAYTGIEDLFRQNPVQGFLHVSNNLSQLGIKPEQLGDIFSQLARHYGGTAPTHTAPAHQNGSGGPAEHQAPAADPSTLLQPILQPFVQRLTSLEATLNQRVEMERTQATRSAETVVERFRSDPQYKFFSDVEEQIGQLIGSGIVPRTGDHAADLAKAYEVACWQHPEIRSQLINEQQAKAESERKARDKEIADKAKAASKSISGSPAPGTVVRDSKASDDLEADVRAAVRQHAA